MRFYKDIISHASQIARRNKYLWWFGLFTLFLGGKGVEFEMYFSNARLLGESTSPFSASFWQLKTWETVQEKVLGIPGGAWPFMAICLVLLAVLLILIVISQGALIDATITLDQGKEYSITQGVEAGKNKFTSLLAINVWGKFLQYVLVAFIAGIIFLVSPSHSVASLVYSILLFLVITPLAMVISLLMKYAQVEIVVYGSRAQQAWKAAWGIFCQHWFLSIEMAALMFLWYFAVGVIALLLAAVATLPVLLFSLVGSIFFQNYVAIDLYVVIFYLAAVIALVVAALYFATLNYAAWTLLYKQLKEADGHIRPKLARLLTKEVSSVGEKKSISKVAPAKTIKTASPKTKRPAPRRAASKTAA